jgi:lysine 2,3-aminomutase
MECYSKNVPAAQPFSSDSDTEQFRRRFFPQTSLTQWKNWRWQLINRITSPQELQRIIALTPEELTALTQGRGLPFSITPYYASLISPNNSDDPLRRTVIPTMQELTFSPVEAEDPLCEEHDSPVRGLVRRYPDRVLFLVSNVCPVYCRYCTRSRIFQKIRRKPTTLLWEEALQYIASHSSIRDVLLSGGEPLLLADGQLEWLLYRLRQIPHVEIVRIGTKAPIVLPQRITSKLLHTLKKYHPLWMSIHVTHYREITPEVAAACNHLADAGIPLGSQTVLLKGINDSETVLKKLLHTLLQIRVRPYYLYQCDPILGSSHFRTPVQTGVDLIHSLRGYTSGYAIPNYVIDTPGGGGKVPLLPEYLVGKSGDQIILKNYRDKIYYYPDLQ